MISKRIIAVLTFDNGILTRTQNFEADYTYTQNFVNNTLFDGIVLSIFIYCVIQCFLKGFSLSLISFMKWIISTIVTIKDF